MRHFDGALPAHQQAGLDQRIGERRELRPVAADQVGLSRHQPFHGAVG